MNISLPKSLCKELFILGNGPSLIKELNFEDYSNKVFLAVNGFANSELYKKIRPKYYAIIDPLYWDDKLLNTDMEEERKIFEKIAKHTSWKMVLFAPQKGKKIIAKLFSANKNIDVNGYNDVVLDSHWSNFNHWFYKKNLATPPFQNVLAAAIFIGINMKYSEIYLFGTDHSWLKNIALNENNEVCVKHDHFYEFEKKMIPWISNNGSVYKMHEILFDLHNIFNGYQKLKIYALNNNVRVVNLTKDSYIDAFEKNS